MASGKDAYRQKASKSCLRIELPRLSKLALVDGELSASLDQPPRWEAMKTAYLPLSGTVAAFTRFRDGFSHQAIEIGRDEMVGSSIAVGRTRSTAAFEARVPGEGLTLPAMTLARMLPDLPTLGRRMAGYVGVVARFLAQNSGCSAHHGLDARLARHPVECVDAAQSDSVAMSHKVIRPGAVQPQAQRERCHETLTATGPRQPGKRFGDAA